MKASVGYNTKRAEFRDELARLDQSLAKVGDLRAPDIEAAVAVFDFSQNAAEIWRGSKIAEKRELLETVSLNRTLGDVTLVVEKRRPFDILAERPQIQLSRGEPSQTTLKNTPFEGSELRRAG